MESLLNESLNVFKLNFYIIFLLSSLNFKLIYSGTNKLGVTPVAPQDKSNFSEISPYCSGLFPFIYLDCFENALIFDHKDYQAHNFALNKNGDLVIEFTEYKEDEYSSSRLFYGLTNQGRYFFSNETSYTNEYNIDIDNYFWDYGSNDEYYYYDFFNMNKTTNLFVSIKNDPNKENQYLFSINYFNFMVELHNLTNNNNTYHIWNFNQFFDLDGFDYVFPYEYFLFELKKESAYIIVFVPKIDIIQEMENITFIKKFRLKSFDNDAYEELGSIQLKDYTENFIIGTFFMDDCNSLVVISAVFNSMIDENIINPLKIRRNSEIMNDMTGSEDVFFPIFGPRYVINFYTNNLVPLNIANNDTIVFEYPLNNNFTRDIYFKSIYLKNKNVFFVYLSGNQLRFDLFKISYNYGGYSWIDGNPSSFDIYIT